MKTFKCIGLMLFMASYSVSAQVSVGWEASCDYDVSVQADAIQQAIDDGATEIRLSNEFEHNVTIEITENLILKGGYSNCADAATDTQVNINSVLDGTGTGLPVVKINNINDAQVSLDSLTIQNGTGVSDGFVKHRGGGLTITTVSGDVILNRLNLTNNQGYFGGGLSIYGTEETGTLTVTASQVAIQDNQSSDSGGGLICESWWSSFNVTLDITDSTIRNNHSNQHGGGMYSQDCDVNFTAGDNLAFVNSNIDKEIFNNTADKSGGGLAALSASVVNLIGTETAGFDVFLNEGNLDVNSSASGGGVFASSSGTQVNLINSIVSTNRIGTYGGGLAASFDAEINMLQDPAGCQYADYCSRLINNENNGMFSIGGGALASRFNGQLTIKNTLIQGNNSEGDGYVLFASPDGVVVLEGNVIINNGMDNTLSNPTAVYLAGDALLTVAYNTLLQNKSNAVLFKLNGAATAVNIYGNIINENSNIYTGNSSIADINCNLINDLSSIEPATQNSIVGTVNFFNSGADNFRLAETDTLAIDVCDSSIYLPGQDLQGNVRGVDLATVTNDLGPYDLGAYEYDDYDLIFMDSFE